MPKVNHRRSLILDIPVEKGDRLTMSTATIKSELYAIADKISEAASYDDAMYQLYVRMKIAKGRQAADDGRVLPHDEVKSRYSK